jgi:energy-coupling factor transporter ATP-binding protein EcfA2
MHAFASGLRSRELRVSAQLSTASVLVAHCVELADSRNSRQDSMSSEATYKCVDLSWNDVSCSAYSKEKGGTIQILQGVCGYARAGKLTSIMGPSGAGKTTMVRSHGPHIHEAHYFRNSPECELHTVVEQLSLHCIDGELPNTGWPRPGMHDQVSGEVLVNDRPVDFSTLRRASAYVQQEDDLPMTENVRECLMFSAQPRLPPSLSRAQRIERVERILSKLVQTPPTPRAVSRNHDCFSMPFVCATA